MNNILITGYPGAGKSTIINHLLLPYSDRIAGVRTKRFFEKNVYRGITIEDFAGNKTVLATWIPEIDDYEINISAFDMIGIPALRFALNHADLIVIDEIGKMEQLHVKYITELKKVFAAPTPLLAVIRKKENELTQQLKHRQDTHLFTITPQNRELQYKKIKRLLQQML